VREIERGAGVVIVTDDAVRTADLSHLARWLSEQPAWSDLGFVLLTLRGGGIDRNPALGRLTQVLGNVTFLERPFHAATLLSVARTALRGRRRGATGRLSCQGEAGHRAPEAAHRRTEPPREEHACHRAEHGFSDAADR
jgi:hypothetical protein